MTASERDRLHFARIADAKREEHRIRALEALTEPPMKRIIEGLEMGYATPTDPATEAMLDARAVGQAELHARARRLGMIR